MKFHLSTSQTPTQFIFGYKGYDSSKRIHAGGFGTVTDEGYGVSYIISGEETGTSHHVMDLCVQYTANTCNSSVVVYWN